MFMFRRRRAALVKSLLKARVRRRTDEDVSSELRNLLMRRLNEAELEALQVAVESKGGSAGCILIADNGPDPRLISVRSWRWPDLDTPAALKKLPSCRSSPGSPCCNPFHWSRLCTPESPPPPYSRFASERLRPEDRAPSESQLELRGSLSTNGEGDSRDRGWCQLAYWELSSRVGRQYPVHTPSVNVFWSLPHGDGLSLQTLAQSVRETPQTVVLKAREKIGKGVTLSQEEDGVWAFNRSDSPMFVNSPALDDPDSTFLVVYRVPPGHCFNVYSGRPRGPISRPQVGPIDRNSVRISFAKGWGPKYSRQEITACPVWLEVLMDPCR